MAIDPYLTVDELVTALVDERNKLDVFETADAATAVRAVFSVSYQALPAEAARVFRLLGLNPGPDFSRPAAAALTALSGGKLRWAMDCLVAANLLEVVGPGRFRFHDLVRTYAMECAENDEAPADRQRAVKAGLTWYLRTALRADRELEPHRRPIIPSDGDDEDVVASPMEWFAKEHANLVAATRQAARTGEVEISWQLPVALRNHLYRRKSWQDWVDTHQIGLMAATGSPVATAALLSSLAVAYREQRRYNEAESCFVRALKLWSGDRYNLAWTSNAYGQARREQGDLADALRWTQQAFLLFGSVGDRHGEGVSSNSLSGICRELGELREAAEHSTRAIEAFRAVDDRYGEAWALNNLAAVHDDLGELTRAADLYHEVARRRAELGDRYGQVLTLFSLGEVLVRLGRDDAIPVLRAVVTAFDALGDPRAAEARALLTHMFDVDHR
jgi:tetratricopeptide (TPR) repeat protein